MATNTFIDNAKVMAKGANHNEMEEEAERAGLIFEEDVMALVKELR
jgi:hypothetical protein